MKSVGQASQKFSPPILDQNRLRAVNDTLAVRANWLVVNIDGTLIGDGPVTSKLIDTISNSNSRLGLVIASGRSPVSIERKLSGTGLLKCADVVIASCGTEIFYGKDRFRDSHWEKQFPENWGARELQSRLENVNWLTRREDDEQRPFRLSYRMAEGLDVATAKAFVEQQLGHLWRHSTVIVSRSNLVDIVPRGAGKLPAIEFICNRFGVSKSRIITAGCSNRDRAMLNVLYRSVVVGNYRHELSSLVRRLSPLRFVSESNGIEGVLDGLRHFGVE